VKCPGCGVDVPEDLRFCYFCGKNLEYEPALRYADLPLGTLIVCPKCGTRNVRTENKCVKCDFDLTDARKAMVVGVAVEPQKYIVKCLTCGSDSPAAAKFCGRCGWSLGLEPSPGPGVDKGKITEEVADWIRITSYLVSFFIPFVGWIIGAIFYTSASQPRSEYRWIGETCFILALIGFLIWLAIGLISLLAGIIVLS